MRLYIFLFYLQKRKLQSLNYQAVKCSNFQNACIIFELFELSWKKSFDKLLVALKKHTSFRKEKFRKKVFLLFLTKTEKKSSRKKIWNSSKATKGPSFVYLQPAKSNFPFWMKIKVMPQIISCFGANMNLLDRIYSIINCVRRK